jgi:hypothetical protein
MYTLILMYNELVHICARELIHRVGKTIRALYLIFDEENIMILDIIYNR